MKILHCLMSTSLVLSSLAAVAAVQPLQLAPGASIEIAHSSGKFDFLRIDSKRNRLLAAHEKDGTADYVDLGQNRLITRLKLGGAVDTAVDADSKFYYVSVQDAERVAVIDAATLKVAASIAIPGVPEFMLYDDKADRIYVNIKSKDVVAVIDPSRNKVIAQWPTAPALQPHGMAFDAASHRVFVAGGDGKLVAIDTHSGLSLGSIDIVPKVDQIAFDQVGGLLYCAGPDKMSVISTTGGKLTILGTLATAATAKNVAVDPATRAVWTTYTDGKRSFAKSWMPPHRP